MVDLTKVTDRDPSTTFSTSTDVYSFALPSVTRATGIKAWGNFVVVAEARSDGTYLEVFNVLKVRNARAGKKLSAADSVGAFKVSSYTSSSELVELSLHHGRAFVSIDESPYGGGTPVPPNPGFFIVDMRPLLDDNATTTTPIALGTLPITRVRQSEIVGNLAYVNTTAGFQIWDVTNAMADPPTAVTSSTPVATVPITNAMSIAVYGTYAYMATQLGQASGAYPRGTYVIDVSTPASPSVIGYAAVEANYYSCGFYNTVHHSTLSVHGTRLYLNANANNWIMELE